VRRQILFITLRGERFGPDPLGATAATEVLFKVKNSVLFILV
jgi:hypothetical protein